MNISRRNFLAYAGATLGLAVSGCQTANYSFGKHKIGEINAVPEANIRKLEKIAQQSIGNPMTVSPHVEGLDISYEKSQQLSAVYTNLSPQKVLVSYSNAKTPRHTEENILDTTLPLNMGRNDSTLLTIEERLSQVPENALTASYDLGHPDRDTLSERTPGNQLSRADGINLIQALSTSKCNNFRVSVKETSYTDLKLRNKDGYKVEIDFSQPKFKATKKRKDFRFFEEMALDGAIASAAAFSGHPLWYLTPGVVILEDAVDGVIAGIESRKAPVDALLSSNTHYITALPRAMSLTSSVLNNSARTQSKEITLVDLFDECNQPSGQGVVYTDGACNIHTSPNCVTFNLCKDKGSELIRLIRRLSKAFPVVLETTRTKVYNSGGGRHGAPGENSYQGSSGGGRNDNPGENSYGGGRGAGGE